MKYYTIYKTTNLINGKFYIGMHKTKDLDDGYMGSGKRLSIAVKCYGIENFAKEILHVFDQEWKMKLAEKILVVTDPEISYNLCPGGGGGWGYVNKTITPDQKKKRILAATSPKANKKRSNSAKNHWKNNNKKRKIWSEYMKRQYETGILTSNWKGRKHTEETKEKMSVKQKQRLSDPTKNSQYGTMWITNGVENRKVTKDIDEIPEGWYKGRKIKNTRRSSIG